MAKDSLKLIEVQQCLDNLRKVRDDIQALETPLVTPSAARVQGIPAVPAQRLVAAPVLPAWVPPAPSVVNKTIRENALAEHKDNFSAMNYEIERQTEGFAKLVRYYKTADPFIKTALNKAALEYGPNYSSFAYDVERQIEARLKFEGK